MTCGSLSDPAELVISVMGEADDNTLVDTLIGDVCDAAPATPALIES